MPSWRVQHVSQTSAGRALPDSNIVGASALSWRCAARRQRHTLQPVVHAELRVVQCHQRDTIDFTPPLHQVHKREPLSAHLSVGDNTAPHGCTMNHHIAKGSPCRMRSPRYQDMPLRTATPKTSPPGKSLDRFSHGWEEGGEGRGGEGRECGPCSEARDAVPQQSGLRPGTIKAPSAHTKNNHVLASHRVPERSPPTWLVAYPRGLPPKSLADEIRGDLSGVGPLSICVTAQHSQTNTVETRN